VISNPSIMYRSFPRYLYREKFLYTEDYDFILIMASDNRRMASLKEHLLLKRVHGKSVTIEKKGHQILFREKAKEFYMQRLKQGIDDYGSFDAHGLASTDVNQIIDKEVIKGLAYSRFSMGENKECRRQVRRYLRNFSHDNDMISLYLLTFMPKALLKVFRKANSFLN
jgi:hypothetical protein